MEQWKEYRLEDFIHFNPTITLKKGTVARKIAMDNLIPHSRKIYSWSIEPYSGGAKFQNGDTIMARITPCLENGKHSYVSILDEGEIAYGSTEYIVMRGINGISNNLFVYYLSQYSKFKNAAVKSMVGSSGRQRAQVDVLKNLAFNLPGLTEQKRIADFLSSLDDKIELNRQINDNLEQQAQALFKSWFVDFEPFKDGEFVDSELGMIPKGWEVVRVSKFINISKETINPNRNPNVLYAHYSIPAFDNGTKPEYQIGAEIKSNKLVVNNGTTLVSKLNPRIKRIWHISKVENNGICSTEFIPYMDKNGNSCFLYCYLTSDVFYGTALSLVNGATGSHQRFHANDTLNFLFPYNASVAHQFNDKVNPILEKKATLLFESHRLEQLRDTLLSRLMSGELKINEINC